RFTRFIVNHEDLTRGTGTLQRGVFGRFRVADGGFVVELRSLTQFLQQQSGHLTSPRCRVRQLGDAECTVDLATGIHPATGLPYRLGQAAAAAVTSRLLFTVQMAS